MRTKANRREKPAGDERRRVDFSPKWKELCCKNTAKRQKSGKNGGFLEKKWSERRDSKHKKGIFIFHKTFNFS